MTSLAPCTPSVPVRVSVHWCKRVAERVGADFCPVTLATGIMWAVDEDRRDLVEYLGRVRRDGVRAFRFRVPDGRYFVALINMDTRCTITVLPPGRPLRLARGDAVPIDPEAVR